MKFPITLGNNILRKNKRHPNTGELVTKPEDIKKVTLDHNIKILTKKDVRPQDKELVVEKQELHDRIMARDNKELDPLEYKTYRTVLVRLKI